MDLLTQHGEELILLTAMLVAIIFFLKIAKKQHKKKRLLRSNIYDIDQLSGEDFELFLYYYYKKHRCRVTLTPFTHDYGADLVIRKYGKRIVIQAKRYRDRVGIKAVQEVIGSMAYYKAKQGMVITNSYYTQSAYVLAKSNGIMLVGRNALERMLEEDKILLP
ncbi:restriction endonuclease [Anaerosporobacter faecicola]|uniref:restriction endonuclease n=1 Tax=Anaerosporobacter faecicola TaxID=2718714 RepID=UPI0014389CCC|nr:restriction endonuclease [Anaerosporobacter faecicola]